MGSISKLVLILVCFAFGSVGLAQYRRVQGAAKISRFGEYQGYSQKTYDDYVRRSDYLALADGTRLAYDLLLPAQGGLPTDEPLPVLFTLTPYLRAFKAVQGERVLLEDLFEMKAYEKAFLRLRAKFAEDGDILDEAFKTEWIKDMLEHGYAVVVVERAGTGASFGRVHPSFKVAAGEADQVLDWIAAQPWCDGNIGMYGDSFQAMLQYAAASTGNPHLKAIMPVSSSFDAYDAVSYSGGIYNRGFNTLFSSSTSALESMIVPVDSDPDGALLAQVLEHRRSMTLSDASERALSKAPYRDSILLDGEKLWEDQMGLYSLLDEINRAGVPVYNSNGWYDLFSRDMFLWHANLEVPKRLHVRPLFHQGMGKAGDDLDFGVEARRWFDYWLKGIDNGIMDEPPIHYYVIDAPAESAWRTSEQWPGPDVQPARFYFAAGRSGSVASANDGLLLSQGPEKSQAYDAYQVDYSTTSGGHSRWQAILAPGDYPDMRANDHKALTFTTPPLETGVELIGHPIVHLWIATGAPDLDVFVYLEEIDRRGRSLYVSEGQLRASHRALAQAPYDNLGLPYQRSYQEDLLPLPAGEPVELVFDLLPTARLFRQGNRIRVTITAADADNFDTPVHKPAPEFRLLRGGEQASFIVLPLRITPY
ncbi:MAG: CocE/NonD family hydrolase [Anaerolineales bacterium]|nr:CocE/NonD family hydrolase [Anaerolineales bacterium]